MFSEISRNLERLRFGSGRSRETNKISEPDNSEGAVIVTSDIGRRRESELYSFNEDGIDSSEDEAAASAPAPHPRRPWDVETARSKLKECDEKHSCRDVKEVPTRLLDLRTDEDRTKIKLVITKEKEIKDRRYAALSDCWGNSTPFTTEPSTLPKRLEGFALTDTPATLIFLICGSTHSASSKAALVMSRPELTGNGSRPA
ncbi:hypothetical protein DL771_004928 [Monosporascus sp. 5C6A]|nr:hypothetical protein DL771_004928 [Monosporascus sp. 5C6A]